MLANISLQIYAHAQGFAIMRCRCRGHCVRCRAAA